MKKQLPNIIAITMIIALSSFRIAIGQTINPPPHLLPLYQNFGATTFSANPSGFTTGIVNGAPVSTQTAAQTSTVTTAATLAPASAIQANGGSYGFANFGNGRFYMQHSASTTTGTNQLIMAINTINWHSILINFDMEMINANPRTAGAVLQYRVGTTGAWSNIAGSVYSHSSSDRSNGAVDSYTNLALPAAANNQTVVQLRWATWRGTQTGASSGIAIDNVSISASPVGFNTNVSASAAGNCSELFLSEYVHDTTVNRAIEIYNPTGISKNLMGYYLTITTGTNTARYIPLSGTIASNKTFVVANSAAGTAILSKANQLVDGLNYSGKDAIGLVFSVNPAVAMVIIDKIGNDSIPTADSGWVVGTGSTKNHTLIRKSKIARGNVEWGTAQYEWESLPLHTYGFLDSHLSGICSPSSMPVAAFQLQSESQNMCPATSDVTLDLVITLTGSTPWGGMDVYVEDAANSSGAVTCSYFPLATDGGTSPDYTYPNPSSSFYHFFANSSGSDQTNFPVTIYYIQTAPANDLWACFGVLDDPNLTNYQTQTSNKDNVLDIQGCAHIGIKSFFNNKQIKVYPNPFNNQFTIENKSQAPILKISITDLLGKEIMKLTPGNAEFINIEMSIFDRGIYFVKLYNNNNDIFTVKLIKE